MIEIEYMTSKPFVDREAVERYVRQQPEWLDISKACVKYLAENPKQVTLGEYWEGSPPENLELGADGEGYYAKWSVYRHGAGQSTYTIFGCSTLESALNALKKLVY